MDRLAVKFKNLGCSLLENTDFSNPKLIEDFFYQRGKIREKIILWSLRAVDASFELPNLKEFLLSFGLCKSQEEATSFVSGEMTFEEQYHIWKSFHDLMVLEKRIEEVKDEIPPKNNDFIGAVSGNMNFRHQIRNPVTIVPFSLERELERSRMPSNTYSTFLNVLKHAESEREKLEQSIGNYTETNIDGLDMILDLECEELSKIKKEFDLKYKADLESWLTRGRTNSNVENVADIQCTAGGLKCIKGLLDDFVTISNCSQVWKTNKDVLNNLLDSSKGSKFLSTANFEYSSNNPGLESTSSFIT